MKYFISKNGYYYKKYNNGKIKRISKEEYKRKKNNMKGGTRFFVGDFVQCEHSDCIAYGIEYVDARNSYVIQKINDGVISIIKMTPELYLKYKKLDETKKLNFISGLATFTHIPEEVAEKTLTPYRPADLSLHNVGDFVQCIHNNCFEHGDHSPKNFYIIKNINDGVISISNMTPELYSEYGKLDKTDILNFISRLTTFTDIPEEAGYTLKPFRPPYIIPSHIRKLNDYDGPFSNNLYMFSGHGTEIESDPTSPDIKLKKNQRIILICKPFCLLYLGKAMDWKLALNSNTSEEFIQNLKDTEISSELCVFENSVPNMKLFPESSSADPKKFRWGLYKIPVSYTFNPGEKYKYLKQTKQVLYGRFELSKKVNVHDISRKRPYLKITSPHTYHETHDTILLRNMIDKFGDDEYTLVLFVCRGSEYYV